MQLFKNRYQAAKVVKAMVGWRTRIVKTDDGYSIQCNGNKYLRPDGFVN